MKIQEIYDQYRIPANLQLHMQRVAAVAVFIAKHCKITLDCKAIAQAGLLHDMANIIKFNLDLFPEFLEPQGKEYWEQVKTDYIREYGDDEHIATIKIISELSVLPTVMHLVMAIGFEHVFNTWRDPDLAAKICAYADCRVGPHGVLSIEERILSGRKRYLSNRPDADRNDELFQQRFEKYQEIEDEIFATCSIKPEEVTDKTIAPWISKLADAEIETKNIW